MILRLKSGSIRDGETAIALEIDGARAEAVSFVYGEGLTKLLRFSTVSLPEGDGWTRDPFEQSTLSRGLGQLLKKVSVGLPSSPEEVILSLPGEMVTNILVHSQYERTNARLKIDLAELKNLIYKIEWKSFDRMRRLLDMKSGGRDKGIRLLNSEIINLEIDGHTVRDPLGMSGSKIAISVLSIFAPTGYLENFAQTLDELGYNLASVQAAPVALGKLIKNDSALIINVRHKTTDVILILDGHMLGFRSFGLGADAFHKKIVHNMRLSKEAATRLWDMYENGELDDNRIDTLKVAVESTGGVWLEGLKLALDELAHKLELPSQLYIVASTATKGMVGSVLQKSAWRRGLSFEGRIQLKELGSESLEILQTVGDFDKSQMSVTLAGLVALVRDGESPSVVEEVLSRVAKIMQ